MVAKLHPLFQPIFRQVEGMEDALRVYATGAERAIATMQEAGRKVEALRAALMMYGAHQEKCPARRTADELRCMGLDRVWRDCTCGFDEALTL